MKRKHLVVVITALTLGCLTGCGGKKSDTESTQAPLETIAPETQSETFQTDG